MDSSELRQRIKGLGYTQRQAAEKLGLSIDGLTKQLYGARPVGRQTAIVVELLERLEKPEIFRSRQREAHFAGLYAILQPAGHSVGE